jgi:peroxiredoxin
MKLQKVFLSAVAAVVLIGLATLPLTAAADAKLAIGAKMENFTLADAGGKNHDFNSLKGKNATVIIFLSTMCPVVNKSYKDRILQISKDYAAKGVNFIGLNSNSTETAEQVKINADERGYIFPVLIDKDAVIADKLGATKTPEVFLFDKDGKLVYRGAIDNDRTGENITAHYLTDAINATLAGKTVAKAETEGFGCSIKRAKN